MEKAKFYVSVQAKTIMEQKNEAAYELEIEANEMEVEKLKELFASLDEFDQASFFRALSPGLPYHHDNENDGYDYYLKEIYKTIYGLGSGETKQYISSMATELNTMGGKEE
jgi:hypothetical protein